MKIPVRNAGEFQRLLSVLADEVVTAHLHFRLYKDLSASIPEYVREFNQSQAFWSLTLAANLDAAVLHLCKVYDQYAGKPPVSLRNFLDTIAAHMDWFDERNFRERLKDNAFVDSLAAMPRRPDPAQLQKDLLDVSKTDPVVKNFTIWRSNFYAHRSITHALDPKAFERDYPIPDIEALLERGLEIANRYSSLFIANVHSPLILGHEDYLDVLEAVRKTLKAEAKRREEEIREINRKLGTNY